jgi:hypothetical protein
MSLFTTLTDERLCFEISNAKRHVILAAPGISLQLAEALLQANSRLSKGSVQVVLDVSAKVARLGYGDHASVVKLTEAGMTVRKHDGLRIGVLICDDSGWSFATSPSLVEASPAEVGGAFNAILLDATQIALLRSELPLITIEDKPGIVPNIAVVGKDPVDGMIVNKVSHALEIAPPQKFDLARQTQVYTALIEFVELSFEGFNIQSRRVRLPKTLPIIASQDETIKERLTASLKVLNQVEKPKELRDITIKLEEIRSAYLVPVGQAGRVMLKSKRRDFEKELSAIQNNLDKCKKTIEADLQLALDTVIESIVPELVRAVITNPPPRFRGLFPLTEESAADFVRSELEKTFPKGSELVEGMKVRIFYKDVTYETLTNKEFSTNVMKMIPSKLLEGSLLQEEVAATAGTVMI